MPNVKQTPGDFVTPSDRDIEAFEAMTPDEQLAFLEHEVGLGFEGKSSPVTPETSRKIFQRALQRRAQRGG